MLKASECFLKESSSETIHRHNNSFIMEIEIMTEIQSHHCNLHVTIVTVIRTTHIEAQTFCSTMRTWSFKILSLSMNLSAQ